MERFCRTCGTSATPIRPRRFRVEFEVIAWLITVFFFGLTFFCANESNKYIEYYGHASNALLIRTGYIACYFLGSLAVTSAVVAFRRFWISDRCPACGATDLIPADTPLAQRALHQA